MSVNEEDIIEGHSLVRWSHYPNPTSKDKLLHTFVQTFRFFSVVHLSLRRFLTPTLLLQFAQVVIWFVPFPILLSICLLSCTVHFALCITFSSSALVLCVNCKWFCGFHRLHPVSRPAFVAFILHTQPHNPKRTFTFHIGFISVSVFMCDSHAI